MNQAILGSPCTDRLDQGFLGNSLEGGWNTRGELSDWKCCGAFFVNLLWWTTSHVMKRLNAYFSCLHSDYWHATGIWGMFPGEDVMVFQSPLFWGVLIQANQPRLTNMNPWRTPQTTLKSLYDFLSILWNHFTCVYFWISLEITVSISIPSLFPWFCFQAVSGHEWILHRCFGHDSRSPEKLLPRWDFTCRRLLVCRVLPFTHCCLL